MPTPEELARINIDRQLTACGWTVQSRSEMNLYAGRGIAVREFPLSTGEADYLLFVDRKAVGVVEAKPEGVTLSGVADQAAKYSVGLPANIPHVTLPLPFLYESTGVETFFRDERDPEPRSRRVFTFHRPEELADILTPPQPSPSQELGWRGSSTLRGRLKDMPSQFPLITTGLWGAQAGEYFDMVLTNPPFGKKSSVTFVTDEGEIKRESQNIVREDFWTSTSNKQLNFVQHIKNILNMTGKAAVVVPDNVLFEGGAGEVVRRKLLHECDVHTLLRLPTGIFYAQGVKANVLFFDRKPASETPWTKQLWIYDLRTNMDFTLKTNPLARANLDGTSV